MIPSEFDIGNGVLIIDCGVAFARRIHCINRVEWAGISGQTQVPYIAVGSMYNHNIAKPSSRYSVYVYYDDAAKQWWIQDSSGRRVVSVILAKEVAYE